MTTTGERRTHDRDETSGRRSFRRRSGAATTSSAYAIDALHVVVIVGAVTRRGRESTRAALQRRLGDDSPAVERPRRSVSSVPDTMRLLLSSSGLEVLVRSDVADERVELAGDVALEAAHDLTLGESVGGALVDVGLGPRVGAHPDQHDRPQS